MCIRDRRWVLQHCCDHPFLQRLLGAYEDAREVYLLTEALLGGDLFDHITRGLTFDVAQFYAACVCAALEHLHARGVAYRDLKPENLLVDASGYLRVCDMGFAKDLGPGGRTYTRCGTAEYMAPEIPTRGVDGNRYGIEVDWWAFGVLVYELFTKRTPFNGPTSLDCAEAARHCLAAGNGGVPFPHDADGEPLVPPAAQQLIRLLLVLSPGARTCDARKHAFFGGLDFVRLVRRALPAPYVPRIDGPSDMRHFEPGLAEPELSAESAYWEAAVARDPSKPCLLYTSPSPRDS